MKNRSRSTFRVLALATLLLGAGPLHAGPVAEHCEECHGKDGLSTESTLPTIAGLSKQYFVDTMTAYKDGGRPCATVTPPGKPKAPVQDMCKVASDLSAADIDSIAEVYAAKPFKAAKQKFDPAKATQGKKVHAQACEKCHSDNGTLAEDDSGLLGGQQMGYLRATLKEYREGKRPQDKKMKEKVDKLADGDVEALVHYYGSLQ
jgi:cytochrome subunit of sulfide dehydrogenase